MFCREFVPPVTGREKLASGRGGGGGEHLSR